MVLDEAGRTGDNRIMTLERAFISLNRFGYGPDVRGLAAAPQAASNPGAFLMSQIRNPVMPANMQDRGGVDKSTAFMRATRGDDPERVQEIMTELWEDYTTFIDDLTRERINSPNPFAERLVAFWTNHFTVSLQNRATLGLYRDYQYKAIRPHIAGNFADMLIAAAQHPAMLLYLDNIISFGPNSRFAARRGRGLNENLAREILELHTLGVNGGYTQTDVVELAKMLTGWTLGRERGEGVVSEFSFVNFVHEPGDKTLLGQTFREDGVNEGIKALRMLAVHPSTARHVAQKLATHFISDNPPESLVSRWEHVVKHANRELYKKAAGLVNAPESGTQPLNKIKTTPDFVISAFRATGNTQPERRQILGSFETMDFRAFNAPSPQGFSDQSADWAAPGAVMKRIEWAQQFSKRMRVSMNPYELGQKLFGPVMSGPTAFALEGAESGQQGLVLLLMSPEFQRR